MLPSSALFTVDPLPLMTTTNGIFEVSLNNANEALEGGKKDRVEQIIASFDK